MIKTTIEIDGEEFSFTSFTWFNFLLNINRVMKEAKVSYPIGEDEEIKIVRKKIKDIERFEK